MGLFNAEGASEAIQFKILKTTASEHLFLSFTGDIKTLSKKKRLKLN